MVWTVTTGSACHSREIEVFTPRKLDPVALGGSGRLWGYLQGGHETADYYLGRDGTPTHAAVELHGRLFARLGLDQLDRQAFERLAAGCHPLTGQRLIKTSHTLHRDRATGELVTRGGAHVPGIDCNLSPPKSVSAVLPFLSPADRAALEAAHLAAVRVTIRELEGRVAACRPTIDGQQLHTSGELAMASFTHHTSRPSPEVAAEPGRPPDPQLHSHVFVFNLAGCGSWPASTSRCWSCSPAATATSTSSPPGSRPRRDGRRPPWNAATWPPTTGSPRRPPAARRTGPPTARSSTGAASRRRARSAR